MSGNQQQEASEDPSDDSIDNLANRKRKLLAVIKVNEPINIDRLCDELDLAEDTIFSRISRIRSDLNDARAIVDSEKGYRLNKQYEDDIDISEWTEDEDEEKKELNQREEYILKSLPATLDELAEDLDVTELAIEAHIDSIKEKNYTVEYDEVTSVYKANDGFELRSSEHKGTRTRKANKWLQKWSDELDTRFRTLDTPDVDHRSIAGHQDFVSHITDLHMGDKVHNDSGEEIYNTEITQEVVEYITEKQLEIYELQSQLVEFDTWHELWGGDFLTNEAIYQGQFEDLDAWLDEQHDALVEPILERLKAISEVAPSVNIVCKTGNHGEHRANGNSKQANADLIFYKHIRNTVAQLQKHANMLTNVSFEIGSHAPYKNFEMRGGDIKGHLRHGQHRKAGYRTSASQKEWNQTLLQHDFDIGYMGHVHRGQRFNVNSRPVFVTGTPKPSGEFAEEIAVGDDNNIATVHGVNDSGMTFVYPVDFRDFERESE